MNMLNKICIVTGGANGIGKSIVESFFKEGSNVIIWDLDLKSANILRDNLIKRNKSNNEILVKKLDITKSTEIRESITEILVKFKSIDILVNNAGIYSICDISKEDESDWDKLMEVNLKGTFLCIKEVLPIMIKRKYGKIINISSISGKKESIFASPSYCASKAGIIGLTRCIAAQVAKYNINVNCIAPALTDTNSISILDEKKINVAINTIPLNRMGKPEDVANAVLFLAKDDSSFITGETINVNGGSFME